MLRMSIDIPLHVLCTRVSYTCTYVCGCVRMRERLAGVDHSGVSRTCMCMCTWARESACVRDE